MTMIRRRIILQMDPEVVWPPVLTEIRRSGFGTADLCFTLNISRSLLSAWEKGASKPNFEHGRAILKLHAKVVKKSETHCETEVA